MILEFSYIRNGVYYGIRPSTCLKRLFDRTPKVCAVIGTFAAVPYIHMHLEARKRFFPEVPLLVHDDCSAKGPELAELCKVYSAEFQTAVKRMPACRGDMTAVWAGIFWALDIDCDVVFKMSRRFVPTSKWDSSLEELAGDSQYATYCAWTKTYNFGFRSECMAVAAKEWLRLGLADEVATQICRPGGVLFVEGIMHNLARRAADSRCDLARAYDLKVGPRPTAKDGYAVWDFLGTDRGEKNDRFLWHDHASPADYAAKAQEWGLPYKEADFADPNQGLGAYPR